jgi:hypothetical protein
MGVGHESEGVGGFDACGRAVEFQMVLAVAEALREEFGVYIDAHPGGEGNEAGVVNRGFRVMAGVILGGIVSPGDDPVAVLTWALRQFALRRLAELGVDGGLAERLLGSEPGLGDCWLAYLALAPATIMEELIRDRTVE